MAATARLPGIQFEVVAPPVTEALPRMDIAVFVGFAASGPLQQPVAVEDIAHFHEIFGEDLVLARSDVQNQPVYAYLPSAVRAFFRNGGRRCWVIRVAGATAAVTQVPIPNLFLLNSGATQPAFARARSEGSWADGLTTATTLESQSIAVTSFSISPLSAGLVLTGSNQVAPGDLLRFTFPGTQDKLWMFVDSVTPQSVASPPGVRTTGQMVTVTGATTYWQINSSPPGSLTSPLASNLPICEVLAMTLYAKNGADDSWRLTGLGFAPQHPRYWAGLPDDTEVYTSATLDGGWPDAAHPRFPLAGWNRGSLFLPLGMDALPVFGDLVPQNLDGLVRDGLANFDSSLFLDPQLTDPPVIDLMAEADYLRYQSPSPRNLTGIHAALAIDEATIIAAPDAVHRGWMRVDRAALSSPPDSSPLQHPEWWHFLDCQQKQDIPRVPVPPAGEFMACDNVVIAPPQISSTPVENGSYSLVWTPQPGATDILEEATNPSFLGSAVIYQGSSGKVSFYGKSEGDYFYRMRRQVGASSSDYSHGVAVRIEAGADWQILPADAYRDDVLLDVHRALVRMSAARGDLFAILAMPAHYRERDALAHAAQLRSDTVVQFVVPPIGQSERTVLSYGALYFPWMTGREENDLTNLRDNPPDGAASGILAKRSTDRGAWVSPGNEPLHGVVALTPKVGRPYWPAFQDAQIDLVRQEAGGFVVLSSATLSTDPDLTQINVRRLLSLLRKVALKLGAQYVFEPNSADFRRSVQRGFEIMLDGMFQRGAFSGRTSREGFQVVTDSSINTPASIEQGRFFVELRVAPSLPLQFLTVRLMQTADRSSVTEGK